MSLIKNIKMLLDINLCKFDISLFMLNKSTSRGSDLQLENIFRLFLYSMKIPEEFILTETVLMIQSLVLNTLVDQV